MSEEIQFRVEVDETNLDNFERRKDAIVKETNDTIQTLDKESKLSFNRVLGMARLGWSAIDQIFQALGINLGEQLRLIIQSAISSVSIFQSIYAAETFTPYTAAFGFASLLELEMAIIAIGQAQSGQAELASRTADASRAIFSVGNFINGLSFIR